MKIQIQSIRFDADKKLLRFINRKVNKLEKFYERVIDADVMLRLNNSNYENKTVEIKLNIPRSQLFAKEKSNTFEGATDLAVAALKRQLKKFKEKQMMH